MSAQPSVHCRVAIVDDHVAVSEMLTVIVDMRDDFQVVGAAHDGTSAVDLCRREQPDVVILDLVMPQISGVQLATEIKMVSPQSRFLIFSGNLSLVAVRNVLAIGVHGVVDKMSPISDLCDAITTVAGGGIYFTSHVSGLIKTLVREGPRAVSGAELSNRERLVLRYLAEGRSAKEVGEMLGISESTVVSHRTSLMRKAGLRRTAQLSFYAAQIGLIGETLDHQY